MTARKEYLDDLVQRARRNDQEATQILLDELDGLLAQIALKWVRDGVEKEDLMAAGVVGVLKAIRHYNPDEGVLFSTYAWHWIMRETGKEARRWALSVVLPHWKWERYCRATRERSALTGEDVPSGAARGDVTAAVAARLHETAQRYEEQGTEERKLQEMFAFENQQSLEDDSVPGRTILSRLQADDDVAADAESAVLGSRAVEILSEMLDNGRREQAQAIIWYFGLGDEERLTLDEIGERLGGYTGATAYSRRKDGLAYIRERLQVAV